VIISLSLISIAWSDPGSNPAAIANRLVEIAPLRAQRITEHAPPIPQDAWSRAAGGEVITGVVSVDGHRAKAGWGVAVLPVGVGQLWSGLADERSHQSLLGLAHVELIRGEPCAVQRHVMMVMPLPIISDRWWIVENRYNTALADQTGGQVRELIWTGITDPEAEPISEAGRAHIKDAVAVTFNHGAWLLIGLDEGHTLVEYFSWSDPGGDLPPGPASAFASTAIADTISAMGRYAAGGQSPCP
jgi:hypothetical protein